MSKYTASSSSSRDRRDRDRYEPASSRSQRDPHADRGDRERDRDKDRRGGDSFRRPEGRSREPYSQPSRASSRYPVLDDPYYSQRQHQRKRPADGGLDLEGLMDSADKDSVAEKLDEVMQKRREKVEQWRLARKPKTELPPGPPRTGSSSPLSQAEPVSQQSSAGSGSGAETGATWSLEKEDDDDDGETPSADANGNGSSQASPAGNGAVEEEVDPLDAYMAEVYKDARGGAASRDAPRARVVVLNSAGSASGVVAGAGGIVAKDKGEILEADDDRAPLPEDIDIEQAASSLFAKGRSLPQTDHTKVYYRAFRKDFYKEVPEIARMTKKEVDDYREELESIKVRGRNSPKPIKNWAQCGVDLKVMTILKRNNYIKPTPIQAQAIPSIMSGRDVIGIAKTGSGKTLAFLLPLIRHVMDQEPLDEMDGPIALVMAPTRELALQTWKEATKLATPLGLRVVCVYGGVGISEQIADLKKGAEVVVCTPGRMIDMLAANNGKVTNLRRVTYLVLDEADRMFDMGFEPQVTKIVNNIRPDRQTVLFSATFPKHMEALARKVLDKPIEIQVGGKSIVAKEIEQHALLIDEHQKFLKLLELLGKYQEDGNVLVFVDKQEKADDVVAQLMRSGYNCNPLHGGIDQFDRDSTIVDFKMGRLKLMVATSVAARGLDVKKLILVVNYDCPNHYEDYVHRVGRTGRAGNKGTAYTFILPSGQEKMAGEVCRAFELAAATPPEDVKANWEQFRDQMRAEGIEIHSGGGGFYGQGYKYDEAEDETAGNKRKMTKLVHGLETSVDDDDATVDDQLASMMKSKKRVVQGRPGKPATKLDAAAEQKVAAARAAAEKIAALKQLNKPETIEKDATSLTAEAIMKGGDAAPASISAASIARAKALELNEKLNYLPSALPGNAEEEQQQTYFEEELEINDFPQQLRYRVCSRDAIAQVQEFADVGISVKGSHYPPGKEPREGQDRKLYLLLEARDELSLRRGKEEVLRIMREALRQMTASGANRHQGGRYKLF